MASVYKKPDEQLQEQQAAAQPAAVQQTAAPTEAAAPVYADTQSGTKGLLGLSRDTKVNLGRLQQGYTEGSAVTAARSYLDQLQQSKPGEYQSRYADRLDALYDQIQGRKPFRYSLNGDALWNQYKDQYMQAGKQAMLDATAQAAALTGGYGNSYGASAGNQAYQQYLLQMTAQIPQFYDRARAAYDQEGADLRGLYDLAAQADATDYGRYSDRLAQWNTDRSWGTGNLDTEYGRDYGQYTNDLNYWQNLAASENQQYMTNRQYAYNLAVQMLAGGSMPSDAMLKLAGISKKDANSLLHPVTRYVRVGPKKTTGDEEELDAVSGAAPSNKDKKKGSGLLILNTQR